MTKILDSIRNAMIGNNSHDAILAVTIAALPVLLFLYIVNRQRHPRPGARLWPQTLGWVFLGVVRKWAEQIGSKHER